MHPRPAPAAAALALALLPVLLCLLSAARAESGPYVQVFAGPNFLGDDEYELDADVGPSGPDRAFGTIDPDYEVGFNLGGAVGYRFNDFLRAEAEVAYQMNGLDGGGGVGRALAIEDLDGDAGILSAMANAYVEGAFGFPLKPFLGLGVGVARVTLDDVGGTVTVVPTLPVLPVISGDVDEVIDDDDTVLAGQVIAGLSFDVDEHWTTAFSYRFFAVLDAEFETSRIAGVVDPQEFEADFYSHALRFEARYRF